MRAFAGVVSLLLIFAGALPASAAERSRGADHIRVVGDLDGDGVADTVGVETTPPEHDTPVLAIGGMETVVTARRGTDGTTLWSVTTQGDYVFPARLGANGRPGVLVVDGAVVDGYTALSGGAFGSQVGGASVIADGRALKLTALEGRTGETAWSRTFEGGPVAGTATNAPSGEHRQVLVAEKYTALVATLSGGAVDRFLITTVTRKDTPSGITSTNIATVVGGAEGKDLTTVNLASENTRPVVRATGDLDGDGVGDLVFLRTAGATGITAYSSQTGQQIWGNADVGVSDWATVERVGDLTGDRREEMVITGDEDVAQTQLLDGATGAVRLATGLGSLTPVGDTDDDGLSNLVAATVRDKAVAYALHDADGAGGATVAHDIDAPEGASQVTATPAAPVGDVNNDGVPDLAHTVTYELAGQWHNKRTVVSGLDLSVIRRGVSAMPLSRPNGQATGKFVDASLADDQVSLRLVDGRSGTATWTQTIDNFLPGATGLQLRATAADVTGDGVLDILANVALTKPLCRSGVHVPVNGQCVEGQSSTTTVRTFVLSTTGGALHWQA